MLGINNVFVKYGDRVILGHVTVTFQENDRVGLVGRNGAGKSTLLKIIAKEQSPHAGNIVFPRNASLGFLHQDMMLPKGRTVMQEAMSAFDEMREIEKRIASINTEIAERKDYESDAYMQLLNELSDLNEQFHLVGGQSTMEAEVYRILMGLGFKEADFGRQTTTFSGGWQMRVELAKMLLKNPDILLLDEPTNHLDIESILWLEDFLQTYEGCVIVISHDKTFLDNVTRRTVEIELGKAYDYKANYSKYLLLRKERQEQMQNAYENQQREIVRKERLIERFRAKANKAKMAQSLIKELDRMERIELEQTNSSSMKIQFPPPPRSGEVVVDVKGVTKRYGEIAVLQNVDLQIIRGERVAFVGKNGEGKSTLSKIIIGMLQSEGVAKMGYNVELGYYAQNQAETLDPKLTVYETIEKDAPPEQRTKLRGILGAFLFSGEDADKKVMVLSGGERARLALACMILRPSNLLVLDEPTNHLDITSKNVLKAAIQDYKGTLIVVSHDRDFLEGLTDKTIEFNNKKLKVYLGDIKHFLEKRAVDNFREVSLGVGNKKEARPLKTPEKEIKKEKKDFNKEEQQEWRRLNKIVQNAERKIARLEIDVEKCEKKMGDMSIFGTAEYDKIIKKYEQAKLDLEKAMLAWETAETALEDFQNL